MIKDYKASDIRRFVWSCRAVVLSKALDIDETLAINRLGNKLKGTIEEKFESDLDYIQSTSEKLTNDFQEQAQKKAKGDGKKFNEAFGTLLSESEEYKALAKKETELMGEKIPFALDKPVKISKSTLVAGEYESTQTRMPDQVVVKYRSPERVIDPWGALIDLVDEGFIEFEDDEEEDAEVRPLKKKTK